MLASLTPCLRQRSETETPASCSFSIPTICSSLKRFRFISLVLPLRPELTSTWIKLQGQGHRRCNGFHSSGDKLQDERFLCTSVIISVIVFGATRVIAQEIKWQSDHN